VDPEALALLNVDYIAQAAKVERLEAEVQRMKDLCFRLGYDINQQRVGMEAAAKIAADFYGELSDEANWEQDGCWNLKPSEASTQIAAAIRGSINDPDEADHGNKQFLSGFRAKDAD